MYFLFTHYVIVCCKIHEVDVPFLRNWSAVSDQIVSWFGERCVSRDRISLVSLRNSIKRGLFSFESGPVATACSMVPKVWAPRQSDAVGSR